MSKATRAVTALVVVCWCVPAMAGSVAVTDYSWLQLPPGDVTASVGSTTGAGGTDWGPPESFRWGKRAWIPNATFTGTGSADYWAALQLDQQRNVENVWVRWYLTGGAGIKAFRVEASNDGSTWTQIGSHDYGSFQTGDGLKTNVDVTDGDYEYVRVYIQSGDYTDNGGWVGRPGLWTIEPVGDGTVDEAQLNRANGPNLGTTIVNHSLERNGLRWNDGSLDDYDPHTGAEGVWQADDYAEIDLQAVVPVDTAILDWYGQWGGTAFKVRYSTDGVTFQDVTGLSAPTQFAVVDGRGATMHTFDPVLARYLRIYDVTVGGGGYGLFEQLLVFGEPMGEPIPEPATLVLLGAGGLAVLGRRRQRPRT